MNEAVARLLQNPVSFLADAPSGDEISISTRVRLARNLADFPFPTAATPAQAAAVREAVERAIRETAPFDTGALFLPIRDLTDNEKELLFERHLASRELLTDHTGEGALIVADDERDSIMVNEEDHLRLQAIGPGCRLDEVYAAVDRLENRLAAQLPFAYDEKLGCLTSCPTNVGTGMRASVMLHLPGLVISNQITAVRHGISHLHCTVRGVFGEGSDNRGNLFQISNQSTLGLTEQEILIRLGDVIRQVIEHERITRAQLLEKNRHAIFDYIGRSYGMLRYAYRLSVEDALNALSGLRLSVDLGMFRSVDRHLVNDLFLHTHPAHLQQYAGCELTPGETDIRRAEFFRERLRTAALP